MRAKELPIGPEVIGEDWEAAARVVYAYLEHRVSTSSDIDLIGLTLGPVFPLEAEGMPGIVLYERGYHFAAGCRGLH